MPLDMVVRGVTFLDGSNPVDRVIVTATLRLDDPTLADLTDAKGGAFTGTAEVLGVNYTLASTKAVTSVGPLADVAITVNARVPGDVASFVKTGIPSGGTGMYGGEAHCTAYVTVPGKAAPPPPPEVPDPPAVPGTGLYGRYYQENKSMSGVPLERVEDIDFPTVDNPIPNGFRDWNMSVRWVGYVMAPVKGGYVFRFTHTNGCRLYIDNVKLIDDWSTDGGVTTTTTVTFAEEEQKSIRVELTCAGKPSRTYDHDGSPESQDIYETTRAVAKLEWRYPGQAWEIVPLVNLYTGEVEEPVVPPPDSGGEAAVSNPVRAKAYTKLINRYPEV